jgi:hypothetical protein
MSTTLHPSWPQASVSAFKSSQLYDDLSSDDDDYDHLLDPSVDPSYPMIPDDTYPGIPDDLTFLARPSSFPGYNALPASAPHFPDCTSPGFDVFKTQKPTPSAFSSTYSEFPDCTSPCFDVFKTQTPTPSAFSSTYSESSFNNPPIKTDRPDDALQPDVQRTQPHPQPGPSAFPPPLVSLHPQLLPRLKTSLDALAVHLFYGAQPLPPRRLLTKSADFRPRIRRASPLHQSRPQPAPTNTADPPSPPTQAARRPYSSFQSSIDEFFSTFHACPHRTVVTSSHLPINATLHSQDCQDCVEFLPRTPLPGRPSSTTTSATLPLPCRPSSTATSASFEVTSPNFFLPV